MSGTFKTVHGTAARLPSMNTWLLASARLLLLVGAVHSARGERRGRHPGGTALLAAAALMLVGLAQVGQR